MMLIPRKQVGAQPKLGHAVGIKYFSAHNPFCLLWQQYVLIFQSTSRSTAQTLLHTARYLPFKNMSSLSLLNWATQRKTVQSKASLTHTSFLLLAQKGSQTTWYYTTYACRTSKCCCHHSTDEATSHRRTSNFLEITLQFHSKTCLLPYTTVVKLPDLLLNGFKPILKSEFSNLLRQSFNNTLQCLLIFYDKNVAQSPQSMSHCW